MAKNHLPEHIYPFQNLTHGSLFESITDSGSAGRSENSKSASWALSAPPPRPRMGNSEKF